VNIDSLTPEERLLVAIFMAPEELERRCNQDLFWEDDE
jgi:hypothetical protein